MANTYAEIMKLTDEELIKMHDETTNVNKLSVQYITDELARRQQNKQTETMLDFTRTIVKMTWVITIATIANVVISVVLIFKH